MYCSYAEASTARPGAAWSPESKFTPIDVRRSLNTTSQRLPRRALRRLPRRPLHAVLVALVRECSITVV